MMSSEAEADIDTTMQCCACCGVKEDDDIKLKNCTACYLVKYCGIKCQKKHRPKHKRACKQRAAELRDELLFKQPEGSLFGDCPICCLPLSIDHKRSSIMGCCGKVVCDGCDYANPIHESEGKIQQLCPFCRLPEVKSMEKVEANLMERIKNDDPVALNQMAMYCIKKGEYKRAFEYLTKAAGLNYARAHYELAALYHLGEGVEKDEKKLMYHTEEAAIGGHPDARCNLGSYEYHNGDVERALKHWIIGANLGDDDSLHAIKECFKAELVSKEDYAAALRAHQAAVDTMKSPQREEALVARQAIQNLDAAEAAGDSSEALKIQQQRLDALVGRISPDARHRFYQNLLSEE
mmetsp:Transcript_26513/g.41606  ORF Transcript_26513/g.41606 Transcript_26513/m.41606 type:complete len:350 (+) Transcript_26513:150-1199(+)